MRDRVRSPPPHHARGYSRRDSRHSPPHRHLRHGQTERPRRGTVESRERRDLDGDPDRRLVELPRHDKDLGRRDTASMKFQWNHLLDRSEKSNGVMEETDYRRRMDEDIDSQSWKTTNPNVGLPQRDSKFVMHERNHVLGESDRITSNSSHGSKSILEFGGGSGGTRGNNERIYQDSRFEGVGSSRIMVEEMIYPKVDLAIPNYNPQSGNKRSYPDVGGSYLPSKKFSDDLHKNEELRLDDEMFYGDRPKSYAREREVPRLYSKDEETQLYSREEENLRLYSRGQKPPLFSREEKPFAFYNERESQFPLRDSRHDKISLSQHKPPTADAFGSSINDFRSSYKDSRLAGSDGYNRSSGYLTEPLPNEKANLLMGSHIDYGYSTARKSDYTEMVPLPDKPYGPLSFAKDDNRHIDPLGSRVRDPLLDGYSSRQEHLNDERLRDSRGSPMDRLASSYLDAPRSSYAIGSNVESLGRRDMDLGYDGELYRSHENRSMREDYSYGRNESLKPREERTSSYLRENYAYGRDARPRKERANSYMSKDYDHIYDRVDQSIDGDYYDPLEGLKAEDADVFTQPRDVPKRRRDISERLSIKKKFSSKNWDNRPNKSSLRSSRYRNPWVSNELVRCGRLNDSASRGSSGGKARVLNRVRDIKKRLGPAQPVEPSVKRQKSKMLLRKNEDGDADESVQAEEEGLSEIVKSEPSEKSDEFKQLVRSAFFKFVKQLNEDTVELGKFKEQGKSGSLKCWVCGSGSEEFLDTESLVKHACTATRVGFRAQHLGFHKALCVLMGWKAAEIHKDEWVREILSVAENASLKKDLILWPPLVVIHNSSIRKKNPNGQVVVSVEDLQIMIKEMGFGEKAKVCLGKHVSQSILLVKFSATYSGFQEAERLHKFFADHKHGRPEFRKTQLKSPANSNDSLKASANNMQDVLYGFLGIGSDLNKLDSETKKRCVVRSKREIQDLGDAPLKAEQE